MDQPRSASQVLGLTLHDRYRVAEPISSGAMGAVYRAVDLQTGADVALKQSTSPHFDQRFEAEARLLASLQHPRVVRIIDHFSAPGGHYLVMELVRGIELGVLLKERGRPGLPIDQSVEYVRQACEALQYVHDQQIVHRDVKPQNLIIAEHGVVLVDFGIARTLDESESSGTVGIGTPRFMAPEVFGGGRVSPRTDVFGVAATLWNLIAGRPPVYAEPTPLATINPDVTPELEHTISMGLEMIPERRVASVAAFAKALGAPLRTETGISLAVTLDDPDASRSLLEAIVHTAAAIFGAAASSICLTDETTGELVYQSAWGAGAREIVGVRLPRGAGITGGVLDSGEGEAIPDCRADPRFAARIAAGTGYVPNTMLVAPLKRGGRPIGALAVLDRRDGQSYGQDDTERAALFADLAVKALDVAPGSFTGLGQTRGFNTRA
ncbi:MAG: protein kinase domain-containing protein [Solirubrobacteraceae bacterium]